MNLNASGHCTRCLKPVDELVPVINASADNPDPDIDYGDLLPKTDGTSFLVCSCGHILTFGKGLIVRDPTPAEMIALRRRKTLWHVLKRAQEIARGGNA